MRRISDYQAMDLAEELEPLFRNLGTTDEEGHWISAGRAAWKLCERLREELEGGG